MAFAKVMIIGNLGRDPEMRYTPNGRPVTEFSVAVSHRSRDAATGEWQDDQTDWYRVSVWGDRAERAAEQFRKGNKVFVEGRFRTREYEARDGQKRISLDVTADNVIAFGDRARDDEGSFGAPAGGFGAGSGAGAGAGAGTGETVRPTRAPQPTPDDLDDLPF
jgi:single-strand DNA-binding protein